MGKDIKTKSTAGLLIVIVIATVIIINLISTNFFSRLDLTDDNIYSLSESSRALVGNLNDRMTVRAFISEDLPAPHNGDARYIKDLLDDYKAYSNGNLHYEFIDPVKEDKEQEVMGLRIPPAQFNVFRNDKTEFIRGYKGLALMYGDKQEIIPFVENTSNLEYDLSAAIKKLTSTDLPFIGFTIGNGEPDMTAGLQAAYSILQNEYRVQFIDLDNVRNLPDQMDALFVVSPKSKLSGWELYLIDQFIMRGGKVCFLPDKFEVNVGQSLVTPIDNSLEPFINHFGFGLKEELVYDMQCNVIPIQRDMGGYRMQNIVQYPFFLKIVNFNEEVPIVKSIKGLNMLFSSPLDLSVEVPSGAERQVLFTTSEYAGARGLPVDISPDKRYLQADFDREYLPLGAVITGTFSSYFAGREAPVYTGPDTTGDTPLPIKADTGRAESRLVLIGNGTFASDDFRRNNSGFVLLMNIADWMTQDVGLISIRSRAVTARSLSPTSDGTKKIIKYANILAVPLLVVLFGVVRWQFRRSLRRKA